MNSLQNRTSLKHLKRCWPSLFSLTATCPYAKDKANASENGSVSPGAKWEQWKLWTYPLRLDRSEVRKFLNFMEMLPTHKKVLILGSSPDLRDGAFANDKTVYCIDDQLSTLQSMRKNMKYGNYAVDEQLIECPVTEIGNDEQIKDQKFDLILCDEALNWIPLHQWESVMEQLLDRLKDTGFVVIKTFCRAPRGYFDAIESVDDILTKWTASDYSGDTGYLMVHLMAYWSAKKENDDESVSWKEVMGQLDVTQRVMIGMDIQCDDSALWCRTEMELRDLLESNGFYLEDVCYGEDDADKFKFTPIYVLGKQTYRIGGEARKMVTAEDEAKMQNRLSSWGVWGV